MNGCWFRWSWVVLFAAMALPLWGCPRNPNDYDGGNAGEVGPSADGASPREVSEDAPSIPAGLDLGPVVDGDATSDAAETESLDGGGIDCPAERDAPAMVEVWPETDGSLGEVSALDVGSESTGGAAGNGGAGGSTGGAAGGGCTGTFETIQSETGLCVAKMVTIAGPPSDSGNTDYSIDVTEVTVGQYHAWLATNPELPPSTDPQCGYVTSYAESGIPYVGTDPDHGPVGEVDWCDAFMYCKAVGKRMCGAIGGGSLAYADTADANKSQWYRACSNGGVYAYPYGNTWQWYCYDTSYHNPACVVSGFVAPLSNCASTTVGSQSNCVTVEPGYAGVYDLSSNVSEWEDAYFGMDYYHIRGGGYNSTQRDVSCTGGGPVSIATKWAGIRCCSK
jgi:formylglycine-generating enzyme